MNMDKQQAKKKLLFRVTKKDLEIQAFRAGGKGGQHQNKRDTGVRVIHRDSGAVGESREERSQQQNKRTAFQRMAASDTFQKWARIKAAEVEGRTAEIEKYVDRQMHPTNLKIEKMNEQGRWEEMA